MSYFKARNAPNSISAGAPLKTPLGEFTALPWPLAGFKGPTSKGRGAEGKGVEAGTWGDGTGRNGMGWEGKENQNGDRPPTIFGLKVALQQTHKTLFYS